MVMNIALKVSNNEVSEMEISCIGEERVYKIVVQYLININDFCMLSSNIIVYTNGNLVKMNLISFS